MGLGGRPSEEGGGWALYSLSFQNSSKNRKAKKEKERKEMSGQEFGHVDNFSGLTKMSLTQEKWSGQDWKY